MAVRPKKPAAGRRPGGKKRDDQQERRAEQWPTIVIELLRLAVEIFRCL